MADHSPQTLQLQGWLERYRAGDPEAANDLLRHLGQRLQRLTRQMLKGHPAVRRWAETDDVFQGASLRLLRAVRDVQPDSMRAFFALASQQIRRELIDLARHFYGPLGVGANQASNGPASLAPDPADPAAEPSQLAEWRDFHALIDRLPDEQREVIGLIYYQGLTQIDTAQLMGVSVRTVQRWWNAALLDLHDRWPEG